MKFVDTHAHLYLDKFGEDIDDVVDRAINSGVTTIYLPNIDENTISDLDELNQRFPKVFKPMMGLHPCDVREDYEKQLQVIHGHLSKGSYVAIGEIGMDLYWDKTSQGRQEEAFKIQCKWASDLNLPIAIHSRDATDELIEILESNRQWNISGVFHCFTGTLEQAKRVIDLGFMLGIGGVVTFKNTTLRDVLMEVDLKHVVLETDSPFLAPTPHRGKRNESSYIPLIAQTLAEVYQISLEQVAAETTNNANRLFGTD